MSLQQRPTGKPRSTGRLAPGSFAPFQLPTQTPAPGGGPIVPAPGNNPAPLVPATGLAQIRSLTRFDTLAGQFTTLALLAAVLALVAMGVSYFVLSTSAKNFQEIVVSSSPSIVAAEKLGQSLNALDTAAADFQVTSRVDVTSPDFNANVYGDKGLRNDASQRYNQARRDLNDALFLARSNITYPGEADAINVIGTRFYDYLARIEVMRHELDIGHREAALAQYKAAHDIVIGNLGGLPLQNGRSSEEVLRQNGWKDLKVNDQYLGLEANIAKLAKINNVELDKAASAVNNAASINLILVIVAVILVLGVAAWLSFRYAVLTHRIINPGFTIGLALAIVMLGWLIYILTQANDDYKTISKDSFISINAASTAKQSVLDFNGDESRLLLSPNSSGLDSTNPDLTAEVKQAFDAKLLADNFKAKQAEVEKQMALAWSNVTYPKERTALCAIYDNPTGIGPKCSASERPRDKDGKSLPFAWNAYLEQHNLIIDQFNKGLVAEAARISFGLSNESSNRVLDGLDKLSQANQEAFDKSSCAAIGQVQFDKASCSSKMGYLNLLQIVTWIAFPLIVIGALGGAWFARRLF